MNKTNLNPNPDPSIDVVPDAPGRHTLEDSEQGQQTEKSAPVLGQRRQNPPRRKSRLCPP